MPCFDKWSTSKRSSPQLDPPPTWPISFPAPLLAPFSDLTMHKMYICSKQSGCVRIARWGRGVCNFGHSGTILHPLAGEWRIPKFAPILPLSRTLAALA